MALRFGETVRALTVSEDLLYEGLFSLVKYSCREGKIMRGNETFYFSELVGRKVYNCAGDFIGKVMDIAFEIKSRYPRISGLACGELDHIVPIESVAGYNKGMVELGCKFYQVMPEEYGGKSLLIGKRILDKQIIDLQGARLVRVNDVVISQLKNNGEHQMLITAVDVGIRGFFRRMNLEFLVKRLQNKFLGWQYINILENCAKGLQVNREKSLNELNPEDLAQMIESLDYRRRVILAEQLNMEVMGLTMIALKRDLCVELIKSMKPIRAAVILRKLPKQKVEFILSECAEIRRYFGDNKKIESK